MAQFVRNLVEKTPALLNAAVELVPPTPAEIPRAVQSLKKIVNSAQTGSFKQLTVKEAVLNGTAASSVDPLAFRQHHGAALARCHQLPEGYWELVAGRLKKESSPKLGGLTKSGWMTKLLPRDYISKTEERRGTNSGQAL
ncbi:hypothetical protein H8959_005992 [Pygathrix nigripes]